MHVIEHIKSKAHLWAGQSSQSIFGVYTLFWQYELVRAGHCINPNCRQPMSHHEQHPPGRITPRAMHQECFELMTWALTPNCWICAQLLDTETYNAQYQNRMDIHHRIHSGSCMDYFCAMSAKSLGYDIGLYEGNGLELQEYIRMEMPLWQEFYRRRKAHIIDEHECQSMWGYIYGTTQRNKNSASHFGWTMDDFIKSHVRTGGYNLGSGNRHGQKSLTHEGRQMLGYQPIDDDIATMVNRTKRNPNAEVIGVPSSKKGFFRK